MQSHETENTHVGGRYHRQTSEAGVYRSDIPHDASQGINRPFILQVQALVNQLSDRMEERIGSVEHQLIDLNKNLGVLSGLSPEQSSARIVGAGKSLLPSSSAQQTAPVTQRHQVEEGKSEMLRTVMQLEDRITKMKEERQNLINENEKLSIEKENLSTSLEEAGNRQIETVRELEQRLNERQTKISKLTSIIVQQGQQDDGFSDDQLLQAFRELVYMTNNIAYNYYQAPTITSSAREEVEVHAKYFRGWAKCKPEARSYRVRSCIFDTLFKEILAKPCFGLDEETEECLTRIESAIQRSHRVSDENALEWRKSMVTAASWLQVPNPLPRRVMKILWHRLVVVLTPSKSKSERDRFMEMCKKDLLKLCEQTCQFALKIRSTSTNYRVIVPREGDQVKDGSFVQEMSLAPDIPNAQATIVYTLFGGLIKERKQSSDLEGPYDVLEKAQVIGVLPS
ncbi:hypothetical protein BGZ60DRAFT_553461 [Tricladium varicosporioides]|nr:hypothetical protein BGZ60DRAFT_553461 [Hymenoscyphus varicosporioides]